MENFTSNFKIAIISGIFLIIGTFLGGYIQSIGQIKSGEMIIEQKRKEIVISNAAKEYDRIESLYVSYLTTAEELIDELLSVEYDPFAR